MPTLTAVMSDLKQKGKEQTRKLYARHGMDPNRVYGVSVADLKLIAKTIRGQQDLACALYESGNMDAMYLAGMVADGSRLTRDQLEKWTEIAVGLPMISEYTVPWLAVEHPLARHLAVHWMASKEPAIAASGWCTYTGLLVTKPDEELDIKEIQSLLHQIPNEIGAAPNRVKLMMNGFVIAAGTYVIPLLEEAKAAARKLGPVAVDMGETGCKVPLATSCIDKAEKSGKLGKKRKTLRC